MVVSGKSTRGRIVGLLGDGVPRSVTRIAAELGLEVRSVFWACYDLYRLGLVLRSLEPVGVLSLEFVSRHVKKLREFAYVAASEEAGEIVVDGVRYVRSQFAKSPTGPRSTIRSQVMRLLDDGQPRSIRQLAPELGMTEEQVYTAIYTLYKRGGVLRTEKPHAPVTVRKWERPPGHHLWTVSPDGEKDCIIGGEKYVGYKKRDGKSLSQHIMDYVREHLCDKAAFTTQVRKDLEESLGVKVLQSTLMSVLSNHRHREVYLRGYQGAERMTPFEQGFAVTWLDSNLPREQSLAEAKERTDKFLQDKQTTSPLFQRVHSIFDIVTDVSLKRDIASQIFIMSELSCSRHQLELALKKTLELYPSIKRVSIFGDERGEYGYPHYYNEKVLSQEDLQAAFKAKEQYLMKVKSSDERKGHALEGVVWWSLERFRRARFLPQRHRTEGMHPYRHTLHLIKPVRRRKKSAEIDGVWESREQAELCKDAEVTNLLEVKFSLIRRDDVEDFVDIARFSAEFGADAKHGRVIRNGVVLWMAGAAIDNKASILVANEYLTIASYASRLGIKFIPISQINEQLQHHGWEKATVKAICKVAKDAHEAMEMLDQIWAHPKEAKAIITKYTEQNRSILEQERMLEARMKKSRQSRTILDVDDSERETSEEQGNSEKVTASG
jgi:DNA-binding transcriptional ArsR family regulator